MNLQFDDTIVALASAPGSSAAGIIRISGDDIVPCLSNCFESTSAWQRSRRSERHSGQLQLTDSALCIPGTLYYWPTARSFTGQPLAEFHTVSAPPLLESAIENLGSHGARMARPGEFTLRAFLAGRVDLVQAEAILGVIDAYDHEELNLALSQLAGGVSTRIAQARMNLLELLSELEAGLDFVEEDIEFIDRDTLVSRLHDIRTFCEQLYDDSSQRMESTGTLTVVLAGLPNAGKSTLYNTLVGDAQAALVSDVAGTTRDYLVTSLEWEGQSIHLIDTAGMESGKHKISLSAQDFRREQIAQADLVIWCTAADIDSELKDKDQIQRDQLSAEQNVIIVKTKSDLSSEPLKNTSFPDCDVMLSATQGVGIEALKNLILTRLTEYHRGSKFLIGSTASRCRESLRSASQSMQAAEEAATLRMGEELVAIEIRDALQHLGQIVGQVYTDDILDRIFSKFCIGK
ncbi:tRNA uridine-5-carboxymethylaminomethyl(34) synthesis GTPase MnmE [Gimesia aquarii]|uniref:tRNA modification GTPase MnmE n=1 Tax=Gimesia aquarii TaxID=2527964 RepID=A0A517VXA0_9PLAN|nr:tRNA uridine-5-carboxymethylaminomethyl(34) synthesis GTPase MnmE [Gimesia aquarii]QDT97629.1 tRNA modification GTPase MnmE [Gimesia aquarii]